MLSSLKKNLTKRLFLHRSHDFSDTTWPSWWLLAPTVSQWAAEL